MFTSRGAPCVPDKNTPISTARHKHACERVQCSGAYALSCTLCNLCSLVLMCRYMYEMYVHVHCLWDAWHVGLMLHVCTWFILFDINGLDTASVRLVHCNWLSSHHIPLTNGGVPRPCHLDHKYYMLVKQFPSKQIWYRLDHKEPCTCKLL